MVLVKKGIDNFLAELNHWHDYDGFDISSRAVRCNVGQQLIHAIFSGRVYLLDRLLSQSAPRDWRISDVLLLEFVWRHPNDVNHAWC